MPVDDPALISGDRRFLVSVLTEQLTVFDRSLPPDPTTGVAESVALISVAELQRWGVPVQSEPAGSATTLPIAHVIDPIRSSAGDYIVYATIWEADFTASHLWVFHTEWSDDAGAFSVSAASKHPRAMSGSARNLVLRGDSLFVGDFFANGFVEFDVSGPEPVVAGDAQSNPSYDTERPIVDFTGME